MNPFLAGTISFVVGEALSELRIAYQNLSGYSLVYAHLYNALRHFRSTRPDNHAQRLLDEEWMDMETLFKVVGDSSSVKGG